jgi:hypothetical protein
MQQYQCNSILEHRIYCRYVYYLKIDNAGPRRRTANSSYLMTLLGCLKAHCHFQVSLSLGQIRSQTNSANPQTPLLNFHLKNFGLSTLFFFGLTSTLFNDRCQIVTCQDLKRSGNGLYRKATRQGNPKLDIQQTDHDWKGVAFEFKYRALLLKFLFSSVGLIPRSTSATIWPIVEQNVCGE